MYRNTTLGNCLQDTLDEMISNEQVTPQLAVRILLEYDKAINHALLNRTRNRITIKGNLHTYRFCDDVWTFLVKDAEFVDVMNKTKVDTVKIVACDGTKTAKKNE